MGAHLNIDGEQAGLSEDRCRDVMGSLAIALSRYVSLYGADDADIACLKGYAAIARSCGSLLPKEVSACLGDLDRAGESERGRGVMLSRLRAVILAESSASPDGSASIIENDLDFGGHKFKVIECEHLATSIAATIEVSVDLGAVNACELRDRASEWLRSSIRLKGRSLRRVRVTPQFIEADLSYR